jgi:chloramphenicol O-acetyltransferase
MFNSKPNKMTTYSENLKKLQIAFTRKIGYTIYNRECAIDVLNNYKESKTNIIDKIFIDGGLLETKILFK